MRFWSRYWGRLWELNPEREKTEETSGGDLEWEQSPPEVRVIPHPTTLLAQSNAHRLASLLASRRNAGQPIPPDIRRHLEANLDVDLSSVQVRKDEAAAQALNARAFAVGDQIILEKSADISNEQLLAHEATHIVQAQRRGVDNSVSAPNSATEREARAATRDIEVNKPASVVEGSSTAPFVQRQEPPTQGQTSTDPLIRRESVRILLLFQYQQQEGQGAFQLTPTLQSELRRLIPDLTMADIIRLWTPEPVGPMQAFQRLMDGGYLPLLTAPPQPEVPLSAQPQPAAEPERESRVAPFGMGMVGLHFRLNPRVPPPISATIREQISSRGIPFNPRQLDALLAGRDQGIDQIKLILRSIAPSLNVEQRTDLAETIADSLLDQSLQGQLELESPTPIERLQQQEELLQTTQGRVPDLLERVRFGASITIYF